MRYILGKRLAQVMDLFLRILVLHTVDTYCLHTKLHFPFVSADNSDKELCLNYYSDFFAIVDRLGSRNKTYLSLRWNSAVVVPGKDKFVFECTVYLRGELI